MLQEFEERDDMTLDTGICFLIISVDAMEKEALRVSSDGAI